jgi:histidinol dehydrogenase
MPLPDTEGAAPGSDEALASILEAIVALEDERAAVSQDLKTIESRLSALKDAAAKEISDRMAGFGDPSVIHAGRRFTAKIETAVSIPASNRRKVLAACDAVGLDVLQLSQPRIQSWVREQGESRENPPGALASGTALEGLVTEFARPVLRVTRT